MPSVFAPAQMFDQVCGGEEARHLRQREEKRILVRLERRETLRYEGLGQPREDAVVGKGDAEPGDPQHQG
jgi:hypothetical protein